MKAFILTILSAILISTSSSAQQDPGIKPLHLFLQANADSTLIFERTSNWLRLPNYLVISKKQDTLTCYTYRDKMPVAGVPEKIRNAIYKNSIMSVPVAVNAFFKVYPLKPDSLKRFWTDAMALKPWSINDDSVDGQHCPPVQQTGDVITNNRIYDGGGIKLYLITRNHIKVLNFYAPDFYEKQCPGRSGRIAVLKLAALFESTIGKD